MALRVERFTQVTLTSDDPERLAGFYRDTLGFPLDLDGDPDLLSFRCQVGDVGFGIAPRYEPEPAGAAIVLSIGVVDLDAYLSALRQLGIEPVYPPRQRGGVRMTALRDPDGNLVELTEREDAVLGAIEIAVRPRSDEHN